MINNLNDLTMKVTFFSDAEKASHISKTLNVPVEVKETDKGCEISFDINPDFMNIAAFLLFQAGADYAYNESKKIIRQNFNLPTEFK
jgi:alpha-D-ribose 1-methylphosphonate 5-phosphate C-P lyase